MTIPFPPLARVALAMIAFATTACQESTNSTLDPDQLREQRFGEHGEFLLNADHVEIFSVASTGALLLPSATPTKQEFHGFKTYGSTTITGPAEIEAVWSEIHGQIDSLPGDRYTMCFWPRHALRATHGTESRDYLICFECNHLYVYVDIDSDEFERIGLEAKGSPKLNEILDRAKIPREQPKI